MIRSAKYIKTVDYDSEKNNISEFPSDSDTDTDASDDKSICETETVVDVDLPACTYEKETVVDDRPVRIPPVLRRSMPTLSRACYRHGLSDRSVVPANMPYWKVSVRSRLWIHLMS